MTEEKTVIEEITLKVAEKRNKVFFLASFIFQAAKAPL